MLKKPLVELQAEKEFWDPNPLRRYKEAQELQELQLELQERQLADPAMP